jgi:tetratricopeptide (TPR) repeat protein
MRAFSLLLIFVACAEEAPPPTPAPPPALTAEPAAQAFSAGRELQKRGLFTPAEQAYRQALQGDPANPQYAFYLGVTLHALSRYAEARTQFDKALELKPDYAGPRIALGKMLYDVHGQAEEAQRLLAEALELAPEAVEARYTQGIIHQREGQFVEAIAAFGDIVAADTTHAQARAQLGLVHLQQGNYLEAENHLRRSIRLSPHGPASFLGLGQTLLRSGKTEEGQRLLERARVLGEQNAQLRPHQDAVRQNPDQPRAHSNLAGLYNRFGRLKLAAEHYRQSIVIDSTYGLGYQGLGNMYQRRGDDAMAARYYFEALRWDSTLAESHNNLGLLLHKKGELEKAIKQYERAVREAPETGFYHSNLGNGYLETDRLDQAQQAAERALALDDRLYSARVLLGKVHARKGEWEKAIALWEEALPSVAAPDELRQKIAEIRRRLAADQP